MPVKDFSMQLKTLDGQPLLQNEKPLTMGRLIAEALLANPANDAADGADKAGRFTLAMKLVESGAIDVKPEEIVLMKEMAGKTLTTLAVGQIYEFLDK